MYLQVAISQTPFALPLKEISQVLLVCHLQRVPDSPKYFEGFLNYGGNLTPIVNLARLLSLNPEKTQEFSKFVLLKSNGGLGLLVDSVEELLDADTEIEPIDPDASINGCVSGFISNRGKRSMLLAPHNLLTREETSRLESFSQRMRERNEV